MEQRTGLQVRKYSIWERLSDIFQIEPQTPGPSGAFQISSTILPTIDAERQLWENGLYEETKLYTNGQIDPVVFSTGMIPEGELWLAYVIDVECLSGGTQSLTSIQLQGTSDGGAGAKVTIGGTQALANHTHYVSEWPGGIQLPPNTNVYANIDGVIGSGGDVTLRVWHMKTPQSSLIKRPPF